MADETGVHYAVSLRNTTEELWDDVHQRVCFNSYQSPDTGHRPHVRHQNRWLPLGQLPATDSHCYLPVEGMVDAYKRSSQFRDGLLGQPVSFPGVVAWDVLDDERKLLTCHCSRQTVCVGTNQNWPCTDLFLWYGRIEPGEEKTCYGHLLFAEWDVAEFSRHAEDVALKWQAKENLELKS